MPRLSRAVSVAPTASYAHTVNSSYVPYTAPYRHYRNEVDYWSPYRHARYWDNDLYRKTAIADWYTPSQYTSSYSRDWHYPSHYDGYYHPIGDKGYNRYYQPYTPRSADSFYSLSDYGHHYSPRYSDWYNPSRYYNHRSSYNYTPYEYDNYNYLDYAGKYYYRPRHMFHDTVSGPRLTSHYTSRASRCRSEPRLYVEPVNYHKLVSSPGILEWLLLIESLFIESNMVT